MLLPTALALVLAGQDRILAFPTMEALRSARPPADRTFGLVAAYYDRGHRGGGTFYYDATSTDPDDGGVVVRPQSVPEGRSGRWKRSFNGPVCLDFYGLRDGRDLITARENDRRIAAAWKTALRLKPKWSYSVAFSLGSGGMASVADTVLFYREDQATDLDLTGTLYLTPIDVDWSGKAVVHFMGLDVHQLSGTLGVQNRVNPKAGLPACAFAMTRNPEGDHHNWSHVAGFWADGAYTLATLVHAAAEGCLYQHLQLSNEGPGAVVYIGDRILDGFQAKGTLVGLKGQSTTRVTFSGCILFQVDRAQDPGRGNEDRRVVLVQSGVADITFRDTCTAIGRGVVFDFVSGGSGDARNFVITGSNRHESYVWSTGKPRWDDAKATDRYLRSTGVLLADLRVEGLNSGERLETFVELRDVGLCPGVRINGLTSATTSAGTHLLLAGDTTLGPGSVVELGVGSLRISGPRARVQGARVYGTSPTPIRLTDGATASQLLDPDLRRLIDQ